MSADLLCSLAVNSPTAFSIAVGELRTSDFKTRVSRLLGLETLRCGVALAEKLLDDKTALTQCEEILTFCVALSESLLAAGVFLHSRLVTKVYLAMAELAKISGRRGDQIVHLQQALRTATDADQCTAGQLLLTETLLEVGNFSAAKFVGVRLFDKLRRAQTSRSKNCWDALEYVIVLSLVFQISLALNEHTSAKLYLELAVAVASLRQSQSPSHVATIRLNEIVDKMQNTFAHAH